MDFKTLSCSAVFAIFSSAALAEYFPPSYKPEDVDKYIHTFECVEEVTDGVFKAHISGKEWAIPLEAGGWLGVGRPGVVLKEDFEDLQLFQDFYERSRDKLPEDVYEEQIVQLEKAKRALGMKEDTCNVPSALIG